MKGRKPAAAFLPGYILELPKRLLQGLQQGRDMRRFPGPDRDLPIRQFLFQVAADAGGIARDDQGASLDLVIDAAFLDEVRHRVAGEFAGGPGGHDRQALGVLDQQPDRHLAAFDFAGHDEVGEGEVGGDGHRGVFVRGADLVDARGDDHGLLRVGVDVQPFQQQREDPVGGQVAEDHDTAVFGDEDRGIELFHHRVSGHGVRHGDGGEAEGPELGHQGGPAESNLILQGFLEAPGAGVDDQVLEAHAGKLGGQGGQVVVALAAGDQGQAQLFGQGAHGVGIGRGGYTDQGFALLGDLGPGLDDLGFIAAQDQAGVGLIHHLFDQGGEFAGIAVLVVHGNQFRPQHQADPLILQLHELVELLVDFGIGQGGVYFPGNQGRIEEGLFVAEHDGFAADGLDPVLHADLDGADGRRRGRGQLLPHLFRDIGAFFQFRLPASQGHGKGQTGGEATFLAISFGEKFEDFNSR